MKVVVPFAKNILAPLGITTAVLATEAGIQNKIHGSGTITLIISSKEMTDIMKVVQAYEISNILLKGITKKIKNKTKEQNGNKELELQELVMDLPLNFFHSTPSFNKL